MHFSSLGPRGLLVLDQKCMFFPEQSTFPTLEAAVVQIGVNGTWAGYIGGWREEVDRDQV